MRDVAKTRQAASLVVRSLKTSGLFDTMTVTISVTGLELTALKKLSLVSHALAAKLPASAGQEQTVLATTLDELIRQIEIKGAAHG